MSERTHFPAGFRPAARLPAVVLPKLTGERMGAEEAPFFGHSHDQLPQPTPWLLSMIVPRHNIVDRAILLQLKFGSCVFSSEETGFTAC